MVNTAVRAAGTVAGRTDRCLCLHLISNRQRRQAKGPTDNVGGVLQIQGQNILAGAGDPQGFHIILYDGIQLLQYNEIIHLLRKLPNQLIGHRVGKAQLQIGSTLAEHLTGVLIANAAADHADLGIMHLHAIQRRGIGILPQAHQPLLNGLVLVTSHSRNISVLHNVPLIMLHRHLHAIRQGDNAAAVVHADGGAHHDRGVILLGQVEGQLGIVFALLAVSRLQHGHLHVGGKVTAVRLRA